MCFYFNQFSVIIHAQARFKSGLKSSKLVKKHVVVTNSVCPQYCGCIMIPLLTQKPHTVLWHNDYFASLSHRIILYPNNHKVNNAHNFKKFPLSYPPLVGL